MKPGLMIVAILASVLAGAGGGYVASTMTADKTPAPRPTPIATDFDDKPAVVPTGDSSEELTRLRQDVDILRARVDKAGRADTTDKATSDLIDKLSARISQLEKGGTVVAKTDGGGDAPAVSAPQNQLEDAVERYMERRDAERRAAEEAAREQRMNEMVQAGNKALVDRLSTELVLSEDQKVKISSVVENYANARRDVFQRAGEAREAGIEFDWGGEMTVVHNAAAEAVRAELVGSQVSTFNELLGDRSLDRLAGGRGGMGGPGAGGPGMGGGRNQGGGGGRGNR